MKITKAIFPAAGFGTRFLPATKAIPKEMLPLMDKPLIQSAVEEAKDSGLEEMIIVTGMGKTAIEDHFDTSVELELLLKKRNKKEILRMIEKVSDLVHFSYTRQKEPLGLGHAILITKNLIRDDPFAVFLGDDIIDSKVPVMKQMINPPSNLAIIGRYILSPGIFAALEGTRPGKGGELQLTDGLRTLLKTEPVYAYAFKGEGFDAGDKLGCIKANVAFALKRPDLRVELRKFLKG